MIPVELEIKNFLPYRDPGTLSFEGIHIACLAGPNGAGKSSLLDAITWVLWGRARSNTADELMHQGETQMRVSLVFEQGDQRFQVIRQRKTGKRGTSLLELQAWDPETRSWHGISERAIRSTQEKIDSLLRLDYETFVNSAFLLQGKADEFTTKTPSQRKQILANILNLSSWEEYENQAKERVNQVGADLQRLDGRLEEIDRELSRREEYQSELTEREVGAQEVGVKLKTAEEAWSEIEDARREMVQLQRSIDDLTRRITSSKTEIGEAEKQLSSAREQADRAAIQAALDTVRQSLTELLPLETQQEKLQDTYTAHTKEKALLEGVNQALGPETEPLKARTEVLQAATEPVCPTCGQPLDEEHRSYLVDELHSEIEAKRDKYRSNREKIKQIESSLIELEKERRTIEERLKERAALENKVGELNAALGHAKDAQTRAENIDKQITRWEKTIQQDEAERAKLELKIKASEARVEAGAFTQEDIDRLRLEKRMADERVGGARQKLAALDDFERQRKERVEDRTALAQDLSLYSELREAFGRRGVPAMIIETVVPELERVANDLLSRMTDGRMNVRIETQREIKTGEVREALDIIISDELGSRPYDLYSGGESFRINFAIRIALSQLLAHRAGAQLRSLFIDEGFGTQDARGREHLIAAIQNIQKDFDRILVITHIDELKEAFPTRIEVEKTPSGSVFKLS